MVALAHQFGAQQARELVVLGDGALSIWNLTDRYFPRAAQLVDLWHAPERLWTVAEAKFGNQRSVAAKAWMERCALIWSKTSWARSLLSSNGGSRSGKCTGSSGKSSSPSSRATRADAVPELSGTGIHGGERGD